MGTPKIYGVKHSLEEATQVVSFLLRHIKSTDRVGIELTPRRFDFVQNAYRSMPWRRNNKFIEMLAANAESEHMTDSQWNDYCSGMQFFFNVYKSLRKRYATAIPIDEEARFIPITTDNRYLSQIILCPIRKQTFTRADCYNLGPGYDCYAAKQILDFGCTAAVIGAGHAEGVALLTGGRAEFLSPMSNHEAVRALRTDFEQYTGIRFNPDTFRSLPGSAE